jgi:hypothetical protein
MCKLVSNQHIQPLQENDQKFSAQDHNALRCVKNLLESVLPQDWFPEYGCVLLRTEGIEQCRLSLVGLDGWQFAVHK